MSTHNQPAYPCTPCTVGILFPLSRYLDNENDKYSNSILPVIANVGKDKYMYNKSVNLSYPSDCSLPQVNIYSYKFEEIKSLTSIFK